MLFCTQIKNFDDFDNRFGFKRDQQGNYLVNRNGIRQRKNLLPYLFYKVSFSFYRDKGYGLKFASDAAVKVNDNQEAFQYLIDILRPFNLSVNSDIIELPSFANYHIRNMGIPPNDDLNSVYYLDTINNKYYSMKIGRYIQNFLEYIKTLFKKYDVKDSYLFDNERICLFFIEELTERWKNLRLQTQSMKVVINDDFQAIYSFQRRNENNQSFNSCMDDKPNWQFYQQHPHIYQAVSLQDGQGNIYARALLIKCTGMDTGNKYTLLERIYCNKRMYKDLLLDKIRKENVVNVYKDLEAGCRDSKAICDITSNKTIREDLYIPLHFEDGDICAYQDTFKFYYPALKAAFNAPRYKHEVNLAVTALNYSKAWEIN